MTLNGVMAVTLRYFTEVGKPALQKTICGGIYARVYCIFSACTMSSQRKFTFAISSPDEFIVLYVSTSRCKIKSIFISFFSAPSRCYEYASYVRVCWCTTEIECGVPAQCSTARLVAQTGRSYLDVAIYRCSNDNTPGITGSVCQLNGTWSAVSQHCVEQLVFVTPQHSASLH